MEEGGLLPSDVAVAQRSILNEIKALRTEVITQTQSIDALNKALSALEGESNQNAAAIMHIQGQLCSLAKHLAGQRLEERFEALHCEVSSELHYLRSLLLPSSLPGPSSSHCLPSISSPPSPHVPPQIQPGLSQIAQELYHSRRILWEQIGELREEVHDIHHQLNCQREDMQRRLTEKSKDQCMERMMDSCLESEALHGADMSQIQSSLKKITISKGKAPKKSGRVFKPLTPKASLIAPDSDDSSTNLVANGKKETSPTTRK
ncbi:uncharacterized protein LOC134461164 isoform X2 [Engraulis encrasicolus]|uniref:uncharacterized protein LOC134461164 isoform X2 n=1 Tax=Engraulis encrasicolus TaxID=184585 RepID=UPI002FCF261C